MKFLEHFFGVPMAAPETPGLRRIRTTWMMLCCCLLIVVGGIQVWSALFGLWAAAIAAVFVFVTPVCGLVYLVKKTRADDAWLLRESSSCE